MQLRCEANDAGAKEWNEMARCALQRPDCKSVLREIFDRNSVVGNLKQVVALGLSHLSSESGLNPAELTAAIAEAASEIEPDYDDLTLSGLSVLETALMVAAKVVNSLRDEQQFNFEQVVDIYHRSGV